MNLPCFIGKLSLLVLLTLPFQAQAQPTPGLLAEAVDSLVTPYLKAHDFSGAILIAQDGKILFSKAYGMADYASGVQQTTRTGFLVGSVTKQFTAAAVLLLELEGKLSVDDPIARFLPAFPRGNEITLHQLLTHTAGITRDPFADWRDQRESRSLAEVVDVISSYPLEAEPGVQMNYSNCGYVLLAAVIEQASGQSYETFLKTRIFGPLGMSSSHILRAHDIVPNMAQGYDPGTRLFGLMKTPEIDPVNTLGANGLVTTIDDLFRWDQALYTNRLLPESSRTRMFTNHASGRGYGFGIFNRFGRPVIGHDGVTNGFTAFINRYVDDRVTILYASNIRSGTVSILENALAALVFDEPYTSFLPPEAGNVPEHSTEELAEQMGHYELFPGFYLTFSDRDGDVWLAGTGGYPTVLTRVDENLYFYRSMYAYIRFEKREDGVLQSIWIDHNGKEYPAIKVSGTR